MTRILKTEFSICSRFDKCLCGERSDPAQLVGRQLWCSARRCPDHEVSHVNSSWTSGPHKPLSLRFHIPDRRYQTHPPPVPVEMRSKVCTRRRHNVPRSCVNWRSTDVVYWLLANTALCGRYFFFGSEHGQPSGCSQSPFLIHFGHCRPLLRFCVPFLKNEPFCVR